MTLYSAPTGETQLVFRPSKGRVKGAARWTVCLLPVPISRYDIQRELSKANRGLWVGQRKGRAIRRVKAVKQLLDCYIERRSNCWPAMLRNSRLSMSEVSTTSRAE